MPNEHFEYCALSVGQRNVTAVVDSSDLHRGGGALRSRRQVETFIAAIHPSDKAAKVAANAVIAGHLTQIVNAAGHGEVRVRGFRICDRRDGTIRVLKKSGMASRT